MAADYQLSFHDYVSIARRWALVIVLTFGAVLAAAVAVALLTPRVYQATGTIVAEGPQIPGDVVRSTVGGDVEQRIEAISRGIMTRENLLQIAATHQVFDVPEGVVLRESDKVAAMRNSINLQLLGNIATYQRPGATIPFNLSFQHGSPEKALEVANALITLFIESGSTARVQQASQTTEFLNQEAEKLRKQLEDLEQQIAAYKRKQGGALPGIDAVNVASIQSLEADLRESERERNAALDELRTLEVELRAARAGIVAPGLAAGAAPSSTAQELDRAKAELARISGIYTQSHPDVRAQLRRIETLERAVAAEATASNPARAAAEAQMQLAVSRLEVQVATARARADLQADQQRNLRNTIAQLRSQILRAPQVERDLAALQRDYDSAQAKYDDLRAKQLTAQVAENLEGGQQAERFTLLEPPLLPEYPIKPNRKKMVALGFFVALAAAAGVVFLLEKMFARVRGANAVHAITGLRPLVVVPHISTAAEIRAASALRRRLVWSLAAGGLLCIALVHYLIIPLNTLLFQLFAPLG